MVLRNRNIFRVENREIEDGSWILIIDRLQLTSLPHPDLV